MKDDKKCSLCEGKGYYELVRQRVISPGVYGPEITDRFYCDKGFSTTNADGRERLREKISPPNSSV